MTPSSVTLPDSKITIFIIRWKKMFSNSSPGGTDSAVNSSWGRKQELVLAGALLQTVGQLLFQVFPI